MAARYLCVIIAVIVLGGPAFPCRVFADGQMPDQQRQGQPQQQAKSLDLVSDVVADVFSKTNALLTGNLEITMESKAEKRDDYTINAIGQRVPKSSAIRSGSSLHNDNPL